MALTVTEAHAVNTLLDWTLGLSDALGEPIDIERARAAAELLADHANQTLRAGLTAGDIAEHWADLDLPTVTRRKTPEVPAGG